MRMPACRLASLCFLLLPFTPGRGQMVVVKDGFENGRFATSWTSTQGDRLRVVRGSGAGSSSFFARVEGVSSSQAGLARSLKGLSPGSPGARDFTLECWIRLDAPASGARRFSLIVSARSDVARAAASFNLRYQHPNWQAYDGRWQTIAGVAAVRSGAWHRLRVTGRDWGLGIAGRARVDIALLDASNRSSSASGLRIWQDSQGAVDRGGARSLTLQDTWGRNSGFDVDDVTIRALPMPTTATVRPATPRAFSGVYPHSAVTNSSAECGIGALLSRGDRLWFVTYPPHVTTGSDDKLYSLDTRDFAHTTWLAYPGNTDANRYRSTALGLDFIGAAFLDALDTVGFLPVTRAGEMRGRLTGMSPDLRDRSSMLYATMEEGLYRVSFANPSRPVITTLRVDGNHGGPRDLPGRHGKGAYAGQGRFYYTNNGAASGAAGGLVEWDGVSDPARASGWRVVDSAAQYTEVTGPRGSRDIDPSSKDPVWALGWDRASVLLRVRDANAGTWARYRLLRSSATHGHPNGWYTEWPRICDVGLGNGALLMNHHGTLFTFPKDFSARRPGPIRPVSSFLKMIVDAVGHGGDVVFACNDASRFSNRLVGRANSNLLFVPRDSLADYGARPRGDARLWLGAPIAIGQRTDPLAVAGYPERVVHVSHGGSSPLALDVEIDAKGSGQFSKFGSMTIPARGYAFLTLPDAMEAAWLRLVARSASVGVRMAVLASSGETPRDPSRLAALPPAGAGLARSSGLLRTSGAAGSPLEFAADFLDANGAVTGRGYYRARLHATTAALELVPLQDAAAEAAVRRDAATTIDYGVDAASVYVDRDGTRYRLPKLSAAFDRQPANGPRRGRREVVTERSLFQAHGTMYELPRNFGDGGFRQIRPITSHGLEIHDFASWRGMLVLAGARQGAQNDANFVRSSDGRTGLWFGNVDDLWAFGLPRGVGGPWNRTSVTAGVPSDPYLMYGYARKRVDLSHDQASPVDVTLQVDVTGDGNWVDYATLRVPPGRATRHEFPRGFAAHWVRVRAARSCVATARFDYGSYADWNPRVGTGCAGSRGVPSLHADRDERPRLGRDFVLRVDGVPRGQVPPLLLLGARDDVFGTARLPIELVRGCWLRNSIEAVLPMQWSGDRRSARIALPIPADPRLFGARFFAQCVVFDGQAAAGFVLSDAGAATIAR